mgnify:CR=1 FL=1
MNNERSFQRLTAVTAILAALLSTASLMLVLAPVNFNFEAFEKIIHQHPLNFIRCNNLKMNPAELFDRLSKRWQVKQPYPDYPEIMLVETILSPGELGNAIEHILGYYYIQEMRPTKKYR